MFHLTNRRLRDFFTARDGFNREAYFVVHYHISPGDGLTLEEASAYLAGILSVRTIQPLPFESRVTRQTTSGLVLSVQDNGHVSIAYPAELCGDFEGLTHLFALLSSGAEYKYVEHLWVEDFELPPTFAARFTGPRFGVDGIRSHLGIPAVRFQCYYSVSCNVLGTKH
ncbi:MAG: hypothetical protein HY566_01295 [Candidatus Kerfeldbacteria bacterium]|nr:hypothetical protein [Candidatus Kerfeldbacteria bacterium]